MAIEVATWNTFNALSDPQRMPRAVDHILRIGADVAVFPEAYDEAMFAQNDALDTAIALLSAEGYQVTTTPYDDRDHYEFEHGFVGISRLGEHEIVRVEQRQHVAFSVTDPETQAEVDILGVHFDHLDEVRRVATANEVVGEIIDRHAPTVVMGDMNAMHRAGLLAAMLRTGSAKSIAGLLPNGSKIQEHATALTGMATGTTLQVLEAAGLRDVDLSHAPTIQLGMRILPRIVQLDHIFITPQLVAQDFRVHKYTGVSDHRALSAIVRVLG